MTLKEGEKDGVFGCGVLKVLEKGTVSIRSRSAEKAC